MLLAVPAAILLAWQLPPSSNANARPATQAARRRAGRRRPGPPEAPLDTVTVRVLTLNSRGGSADPAAVLAVLRQHAVDVLAVQELTWDLVHRLGEAGLGGLLPHTHLDPQPDSPGTGLWARWPLTPAAAGARPGGRRARARAEPVPGRPVVLTSVHPLTPMRDRGYPWQRDLARLLPLAEKQRAAGGAGRLQRQPGSPAVPRPARGRVRGLRRRRAAPDLARVHLANVLGPVLPPGEPAVPGPPRPALMRLDHVLISRAGRRGARGAPGPGDRHRPPRRAGRDRVHLTCCPQAGLKVGARCYVKHGLSADFGSDAPG